MARALTLIPIAGIPEVTSGVDLASLLHEALLASGLRLEPGDVLVVAQKIVSKVENRAVALAGVCPSERALELARMTAKDPRVVELVLRESREVLRVRPGLIIVEHRLGFVMANAGIDHSNVPQANGGEIVLLLPRDPDASAQALRGRLRELSGVDTGVVINDSFGRAWRNGVVGTAIGVSGIGALVDMRGHPDREGRALRVTQIGAADELAAAASIVMGQGDESTPAVLVRGFPYSMREGSAQELVRPRPQDLFR